MHENYLKKTNFYSPRDSLREHGEKVVQFAKRARFFDDFDHMLSVIGLLRFAMGIPENIIEKSEYYEVIDEQIEGPNSIKQSMKLASGKGENLKIADQRIFKQLTVERSDIKELDGKRDDPSK